MSLRLTDGLSGKYFCFFFFHTTIIEITYRSRKCFARFQAAKANDLDETVDGKRFNYKYHSPKPIEGSSGDGDEKLLSPAS
jgi:hypothetical protein